MFLGRVTIGGRGDLDDWMEVCLVTTAAGDRSAVCLVAAAGDWLAVCCLVGEDDWLEIRWMAGEGDWLEVQWVAGAEFGSSWPKVSVSSSFWVDKM